MQTTAAGRLTESTTKTDSEQIFKCSIFGISWFQMVKIGSNERKFCGDGLELHKDQRRWWDLVVYN